MLPVNGALVRNRTLFVGLQNRCIAINASGAKCWADSDAAAQAYGFDMCFAPKLGHLLFWRNTLISEFCSAELGTFPQNKNFAGNSCRVYGHYPNAATANPRLFRACRVPGVAG